MHENKADLKNPSENLQREHQMVLSQVDHVRRQQGNILEQLRHEQISLENELRSGQCYWSFTGIYSDWPSGNKPLPEPVVTQSYVTMWHHQVIMS